MEGRNIHIYLHTVNVIAIQLTLPSLVHERSNITCNTRAILTIALWLKSESMVAECNNAYSCHYPDKIPHNDVIKWKHFPRYWPFVRGIHRSPVNSQHKGQWRRAFMFSLNFAWINGWVNNRKASDLRRHRAHYDVILMSQMSWLYTGCCSN